MKSIPKFWLVSKIWWKHGRKTCIFCGWVAGCSTFFFVHTPVLSCPYTRATIGLRLRFAWKIVKSPSHCPPPNLISVLVHVIRVLSWIRSIPRSTGTGTESVPAIDNFCYPVPVPFPYSDFPNHSVPVPVTFQHFPILSVPVTFPSMDS